jgi:hypothetical protein
MYPLRINASFNGEELLAPRPNYKFEDHPLSGVGNCLLNIFAATFHIGGPSSIRTLRACHAVMTMTHFIAELAKEGTNKLSVEQTADSPFAMGKEMGRGCLRR